MTFTTPFFLILGTIVALIPIAIHLFSKGKPKKVVFPALRFARAKLATNKRKLTFKRLALLILRVCLFLLLGLALARPFFTSRAAHTNVSLSNSADVGSKLESPTGAVAAAIVVDSSIRMGRIRNNASLFETARATARAIVEQTPKGSEIAILSGEETGDGFQPDRIAARERLDKLTIAPNGRSASETAIEALNLLSRVSLSEKELYILSDATQTGWSERRFAELRRKYEQLQDRDALKIYFVDLGDESYQNASIVDLSLSAETLSSGSPLRIDVDVERVGDKALDATIELILFDSKKLPDNLQDETIFTNSNIVVRREAQTVSFTSGRVKRSINFQTSDLPVGSCIGAVRIIGGDALAADDVRWFSVDVVPEWSLLVVAPEPIATKSLYLAQALAPEDLRKTGRAPFELDVVPYSQKNKKTTVQKSGTPFDLQSAKAVELSRYRAILLLDPPGLDASVIAKLTSFVDDGGGLGLFLGRSAAPIDALQTLEAIHLLGFKPIKIITTDWDREIYPIDNDAPILSPFRPFEQSGIPWDAAPIARYWQLDDLTETASVVAEFRKIADREEIKSDSKSNASPALVENQLGRGLVATLATSISDNAQEQPWNELTSGEAVWLFVVLADGIARRLASSSSSILNYSLGEVATLRSPLKIFPGIATIVTPFGEEIATPTDVERRSIRYPGANEPGIYRVQTAPNRDGESINGAFAVSISAAQFDLSRYSKEDWEKKWEGLPYRTLDLQIASGGLENERRGNNSEPYAFLIVILALLFIAETFVANRFYKKS